MSVGAVNKQTGERIPTAGMPAIDDALDLTSVNPVQNAIVTAALANKQDKTDNNLDTEAKTIVGAINEHEGDIDSLKSGLTNLDVALSVPDNSGKNHVDATTFDSYTSDKGITVTPNGTGGIAVSGANSGMGATGVLLMKSCYSIPLKAGITYRFSGNWSGVTQGSTTIRMDLRPSNTLDVLASEATDGIGTYTPSEDINVRIFARVAGSYTIPSDVTMHPVITVLTDTSYTPYIPSVESRIEAVESVLPTTIISVTADGVKTYAEILESMRPYSTLNCTLTVDNDVYQQMGVKKFANISITSNSGNIRITTMQMASNANKAFQTEIKSDGTSTVTEITQTVPTSGMVFSLVKYF